MFGVNSIAIAISGSHNISQQKLAIFFENLSKAQCSTYYRLVVDRYSMWHFLSEESQKKCGITMLVVSDIIFAAVRCQYNLRSCTENKV